MPSEADSSSSIHAKTTAAKSEITFADGTTYQYSPQTDRDIAEIDEWLQCRVLEIAMKASKLMSDANDRAELLRTATLNAGCVSCMTAEGIRMLATVDGWTRLSWQAIRKNHPEITLSTMRTKMLDPRNIELASQKFLRMNVGTGPSTPKKETPE